MAEKFSLKWNDFQTTVSNAFRKLRSSDNFYDVTLVSDDQQQVSAHKVVLSSSSGYFKNILTSNKHSHPLLCLNGVNKRDLDNILDFIYNGEIQIYQDHLDQFLNIAQRFQLEGLLQGKEENEPTEQFKEDKTFTEKDTMDHVLEIETKGNIVKTQNDKKLVVVESAKFENIKELDQTLNEMIERVDGGSGRICIPCGKLSRDITDARKHAEVHIEGLSFPCLHCKKTFSTRNSHSHHIRKCFIPFLIPSS